MQSTQSKAITFLFFKRRHCLFNKSHYTFDAKNNQCPIAYFEIKSINMLRIS